MMRQIQLQIRRLTFDVDSERRGGEQHHQRLSAEHIEEQAAQRLADDDSLHV